MIVKRIKDKSKNKDESFKLMIIELKSKIIIIIRRIKRRNKEIKKRFWEKEKREIKVKRKENEIIRYDKSNDNK